MSVGSKKKRVQTRLPTVTVGDANVSSATASNAYANQEETPEMDISVLFAEMTKMGAILNGVAEDVSFIKSDMTELKKCCDCDPNTDERTQGAASRTWKTR